MARTANTNRRISVPPKIERQVLDEFNDRCAICGHYRPHIHHIDENPSNNDPSNLLPLCPNCHLTDQHNPTRNIEKGILLLLRKYRDPFVLAPQFKPIFRRMDFFDELQSTITYPTVGNDYEIIKAAGYKANELIHLIGVLEMGEFYEGCLVPLIGFMLSKPAAPPAQFSAPSNMLKAAYAHAAITPTIEKALEYRQRALQNKLKSEELIIEMLCYQRWQAIHRGWVEGAK